MENITKKNKKKFVEIPVQVDEEAHVPMYRSEGASGADVKAHLDEDLIIAPGQSVVVPTGLRVAIPEGYEIQVRPRSGLVLNHRITVANTPGTIDADYRGEIQILLINHGEKNFVITPGMRIAQLVVSPVVHAKFFPMNELVDTLRGSGGFGHTGLY